MCSFVFILTAFALFIYVGFFAPATLKEVISADWSNETCLVCFHRLNQVASENKEHFCLVGFLKAVQSALFIFHIETFTEYMALC